MARSLAERVGNDLAKSAKHLDHDAHRLYRATQRAVLQNLVDSLTNGQEARAARPHANGALGEIRKLPGLDHNAIGSLYEALLSLHPGFDASGAFTVKPGSGHARKASGSYYTPARVVERILDLTLTPALCDAARVSGAKGILRLRVCDPSCGTGNFVLAAARRISEFLARARSRAKSPSTEMLASCLNDVIRHCIYAVDVDEVAVETCRGLLAAMTGGGKSVRSALERNIVCRDALTMDWTASFAGVFRERGGFDLVIGNPPFLNQLEAATAHDRSHAAALKARFGAAAAGYADPSALFLLVGSQIARSGAKGPGGRVALIQPHSLLAARDRAAVRAEALRECTIEAHWIAGERVFDAGVLVCCPFLRKRGTGSLLRLYRGRDVKACGTVRARVDDLRTAPTWAPLGAAAMGVPEFKLDSQSTLGDIAEATADFRDQFYGLRGCVVEGGTVERSGLGLFPPLITTGLIDAAKNNWGSRPTRFAGSTYTAPRVNLESLDEALRRWAKTRLTPKVLLATQTRVLEAVADPQGEWIPAVPVVTVVPREKRMIWHVAAVLLSPVASIWAAREYCGSGLSATAIKLSAKQAMRVPIPGTRGRRMWDDAAKAIAKAHQIDSDDRRWEHLNTAAGFMIQAYGLNMRDGAAAMDWWMGQSNRGNRRPKKQIASR